MGFFVKYVTRSGARNLGKYQYKGTDDSFVYTRITNPYVYSVLVNYLPEWLAPNLITLSGFSLMVMAHIALAYYLPQLQGTAPAWVYYMNAVCLITYQTLDAIDGKQARRTGSSSPMGLIFDHGCDALVTTVIAITLASAAQLGPTWKAMLLWICLAVPFFMATFEEYYTGELHLPIINGPNEGIQLCAIFQILSGLTADDPFWLKEVAFGLKYNDLGLMLFCLSAFGTCVFNVYNIVVAITSNREEIHSNDKDSEVHRPSSFSGVIGPNTYLVAFSRIFPLAFIIAMFSILIVYSPSDVMDRNPIVLLWILGLLLSKMLTGLMLAHLCDEEYHPATRTITAILFLGFHAAYTTYVFAAEGKIAQYEDFVLMNFLGLAFVSYAHMFTGIVQELSEILGIYPFTITQKKPKRKLQ